MRGLTRFLSGILTLAFILMVALGGILTWFNLQVDAEGPLEQPLTVMVRSGDATRLIAQRLEQQGAISSQTVFLAQFMSQNALARLSEKPETKLKAGEYVIPARTSIRGVIKQLSEGRSVLHAVTVPEGLTSYAVVERLRADANLSGEVPAIPDEGTLLPETFRVPRNMARAKVLELLRNEQEKFISAEWATRQPGLPIATPREALILASLVEKESGPRDDPARIAGVFINRLKRKIRLQSDPTILYGKFGPQVKWGSKIFRSDIARKTAYNTYQIDALPPGPICNPGRRAIKAVLNPADTDALYFVADGRGGHIFSRTLREHERAVAQWRKIERGIRAKEAKAKADVAAGTKAAQQPATQVNDAKIRTNPTRTVSIVNRPQTAPVAPETAAAGPGPVPLPVRRPKRR